MKKIFVLLFCIIGFTASFAQNNNGGDGKKNNEPAITKPYTDYKKIADRPYGIYSFSAKERDAAIAKINSDFSFKIKSIKDNRRLKRSQKKMWIQKIQSEKVQQIKAVNAKFNSKYNAAFNDRR